MTDFSNTDFNQFRGQPIEVMKSGSKIFTYHGTVYGDMGDKVQVSSGKPYNTSLGRDYDRVVSVSKKRVVSVGEEST